MDRVKNPPHPGRIVRRSMDSLGLSIDDAAAHLGVRRAYLSDVSAGVDGINADLAVRLAMAFGSSAEVWLGMQAKHDLAQIQEQEIEVGRLGAPGSCDAIFAEAGIEVSPREQPSAGVHVNAGDFDEEKLLYPNGRPRHKAYGCLSTEDGGTTRITLIDMPGCTAQGRTFDLALRAATLAVEQWLWQARAAGRPIPEPREIDEYSADPEIKRARDKGAFLWYVTVDPDNPSKVAQRSAPDR